MSLRDRDQAPHTEETEEGLLSVNITVDNLSEGNRACQRLLEDEGPVRFPVAPRPGSDLMWSVFLSVGQPRECGELSHRTRFAFPW